jgi:hypothetical protein
VGLELGVQQVLRFFGVEAGLPKEIFEAAVELPQVVTGEADLGWREFTSRAEGLLSSRREPERHSS